MKRVHKLNRFGRRSLSALLALVLAFSLLESGVFATIPSDSADETAEDAAVGESTAQEEDTAEDETDVPEESTSTEEVTAEESIEPEETSAEADYYGDTALIAEDISADEEPDEDLIVTYAAGENVFAVYSADDNSLTFYSSDEDEPHNGGTYGEKTATYVYTGFDDDYYSSSTAVPWADVSASIKTVVFDDTFSEVEPLYTAFWFYGCESLTSIDFGNTDEDGDGETDSTNFDTSSVSNMYAMFYECSSLTELDVSLFNTSSVTSMGWMFAYCSGLTALDVGGFNTSNVKGMEAMFHTCSKLTELNLSSFSTSEVTDMRSMFYECNLLKEITFSTVNWKTSSVTDMGWMFYNCSSLEELDVSGFDTDNVTRFTSMFYNCKTLTSLDVSGFSGSKNVTDMTAMFYNCSGLQELKLSDTSGSGDSGFYTEAVTSMESMFYNCSSLTELDLSSFDTSKVTDYDNFAIRCTALQKVTIGDSGSNETSFDLFYKSANALVSQQYWTDEAGELKSDNYLIGIKESGTYYVDSDVAEPIAVYSGDDNSLTFYSDKLENVNVGDPYKGKTVTALYAHFASEYFQYASDAPWSSISESVTTVAFDDSFKDVCPVSTAYWFYGFENMTSIDLTYLDTSGAESTRSMFYNCSSLKELDVSGFDTEQVTDMSYMFYNCSGLKTLAAGGFDASEVTSIRSMFYNCSSLTGLDLSGWNTSNVTDMGWIFYGCESLAELIVYDAVTETGWDTSSVTNMEQMFRDCSELTELDVSAFNTSNVESMYYTFGYCSGLEELDVSGWDTSSVTTMACMFYNCSSLTSLDVSNFETSEVDDMGWMFFECSGLTHLDVSYFNTSKTTNFHSMFYNCYNLTKLDVSGFETSSALDMCYMFCNCSGLTTLNVGGFDTSSVQNIANMFSGCSGVTALDVHEFDTKNVIYMSKMFYNCSSLEVLNLSGFDTSKVTDYADFATGCTALNEIIIGKEGDGGVAAFDLFARSEDALVSQQYWHDIEGELKSENYMIGIKESGTYYVNWVEEPIAVYCEEDHSLTFYYDYLVHVNVGETYNDKTVTAVYTYFASEYFADASSAPWYEVSESIETVAFDETFADVLPVSTAYWFCGFENLTSIDLSNLDTSAVTTMNHMFYGCSALTGLDLSGLDTSAVTNMEYMFSGCSALTGIDLSGVDTSKVTKIEYMFYGCSSLEELDLSSFDTTGEGNFSAGHPEHYRDMLVGLTSLKSLTISDDFTLLGISPEALVSQSNWRDENDILVSDNFMIGFEGGAGTYYPDELSKVYISAVWDDSNDKYGDRPGKVTAVLYGNGEEIEEFELSAGNNWSVETDVYLKDENGVDIEFTVSAEIRLNYLAEVKNEDNHFQITYTYADDEEQDDTRLYGQLEIDPSNKLANVGAVNGGGRLTVTRLRNYADEDGNLTIYLPGELDMPEALTGSTIKFSVLTGKLGNNATGDGVVTLPVFSNQAVKVVGWYNVDTGEYYDVSGKSGGVEATVDLHEENLFYADYIPASYDAGSSTDKGLLETVSTSGFMTIHMFDYNEMFNLYSASIERIEGWNEHWYDSGYLHDQPNATGSTTLGDTFDEKDSTSVGKEISSSFLFRNKGDNSLLYVLNPYAWNGGVTDVFQDASKVWGIKSPSYADNALLNRLFNPASGTIGVQDIGTADYLFSYDESTGIYSYDSEKNGVAFNQTDGRFYVYDSPEEFTDSGVADLFSPFTATGTTENKSAQIDWWFGMEMSADFVLPDQTGTGSANTGMNGEDLFFSISANDDVLVFVDDTLVLDMSGSHVETKSGSAAATSVLVKANVGTGTIDFATGEYEYYIEDNVDASKVTGTLNLDAGKHTLTVYYVERSAFVSDLAVSFDLDATRDISGSKTWDDGNNQDGNRPTEIIIDLRANGNIVESKTVTASDDWSWSFTDLPVYDSNLKEITYTITEDAVDEYSTTYDGFNVTNSYTPGQTSLTVVKDWEDANDQDGIRPKSVEVTLVKNGTATDQTLTLSDSNNWEGTFTELDEYENGTKIEYTVTESSAASGYKTEITGDAAEGYVITNSYTPATTRVSGSLNWEDGNNQDGIRPDSVSVNLLADGTTVNTVTVSAADDWAFSFEDLAQYSSGEEIKYTVSISDPEGKLDDYEMEITGDAAGGYEIILTHIPETISITVTKKWEDADNQDGIRPTSVTIDLLADGKTVETADVEKTNYGFFDWIIAFFSGTLSNGNEWTYTWEDLPKYADGEEITYTVAENPVPEGYTATVGELTGEDGTYDITITNSHTPELVNGDGTFRVVLVWDDEANNDGLRPEEVNVTLTSDNAKVEGMTLTLDGSETDEDGNWIGTFTGLDKYADGEEITYSVKEDIRSGYTYKIELLTDNDGNTYVQLTNVHVSVKEEIGFTKVWYDGSDQDGKRPDEITIRLLANGGLYKEVKLTEDNVTVSGDGNKWEYTLKDIPVDKNGVAIEYTLTEEDIDDYTSSIETTRGSEITDNEVTYRPYFFTATNSYTPETIDEISGSKTWDDADNQDGMRPKEITIRLLADGSEVDSMTVSEKDGWSWTFTGLPKYAGGEEIAYTITEDAVEDYSTEYDGYNVTNTHTPGQTSLTVVKSWEDEGNQDGIRPQSVEVTLLKNGAATDQTITLSDSNGWTDSFIELDEYTSGVKNKYTVQETEVDGYTDTVTGDETEGYQITNTHEPETVDVAGSITWDDDDNEFGFRPHSITVHLFADDTEIDSMVVTAEDNWTWDFGELPQYADGQEITYSFTVELTAEGSEHYTVEVDGDRVIIHLNNEIFDLTVVKIWEDADDQDGIRPESVEITLLNNGEPTDQTLTLSEENDWEGDFTDLEEHTSNVWNDYTVQESAVGGYTCEITGSVEDGGYVVVNTHTPETVNVSGSKTWDDNNDQDGMRPDSITIRLLADGTEADSAVVTAEDGWSWTFEDLDKYENGEEITYTIVENAVEDYSVTYDGYDVTNSYTPEKTSVSVVKTWDDSSDADGTRPDEITVALLKDGADTGRTLTLSSGDGWQGSFTELDVYDSGEKIDYTVRESEPDGYTSKITGDAGSGYVITNTLVRQETTDVTVTILWDDNDDAYGARPSSLTVHLYADGVEIASQVVTAEDGWTWDFGQLDKYDADGNEISYTFSVDSPEGGHYVFEIDGNTITARYTPGDNTESPGPTVSGNGGNGGSGGKGGTNGNNPSPKTDGPEPAIRMIALAAGIAAAAVGGAALSLRAYRRSRVVYVGKRLKK